jgi:mono/diheme cytochrome c family protein
MKKLLLSLTISLPILLLMAGTLEAMTSSTNDANSAPAIGVDLGRGDFMRYCAACHGVSAKGDGTIAEFLTLKAADLTMLRKMNAGTFPRERITEVIDGRIQVKVHGLRDMPVWGDWFLHEAGMSDVAKDNKEDVVNARIKALVDYLETIQQN